MADSSYYVISFFIYSVIGYICEVIYCSVPKRRFVNRGFLYGPYCPIYGSGALSVIILLNPFREHWYLVFLFGLVITSVIEYITSFLLEKIFHMKLWDYSKHKININGRVCGLNSFLFGLMSLIAVYVVEPFASDIINDIPLDLRNLVSYLILISLAVDTTVTVINLKSFQRGLNEIKEKAEYIKSLDSAEIREAFNEELEKRKENAAKAFGHFVRSNPSLSARSLEARQAIEDFKEYVENRNRIKKEFKEALKQNREEYVNKRTK